MHLLQLSSNHPVDLDQREMEVVLMAVRETEHTRCVQAKARRVEPKVKVSLILMMYQPCLQEISNQLMHARYRWGMQTST